MTSEMKNPLQSGEMPRTADGTTLPPGQRLIEGFPRFGAHLGRPAPEVPVDPYITIRGAMADDFDVPLATLASLARRELRADFHCVSGWSATNLVWEGVPFEVFYRSVIAPALAPGTAVTHLVFVGLDHWRSVVTIEDALADDVLIAEHLDGRPLDSDHGAPARLVSPDQYGYINTKHLCRIEVHVSEPKDSLATSVKALLVRQHPRARVWEEERHRFLPNWSIRHAYRALIGPFIYLCNRDSARSHNTQRPRLTGDRTDRGSG